PMQSLCTLRNQRRRWPRNTRYQAGAAPYLGRTYTGWIAPVRLAHSFDHLVGAGGNPERDLDTERLGRLHIDHQFELARLHNWQIGWLLSLENASDIVAGEAIGIS